MVDPDREERYWRTRPQAEVLSLIAALRAEIEIGDGEFLRLVREVAEDARVNNLSELCRHQRARLAATLYLVCSERLALA